MPFNLTGAREAGLTDEQIAASLAANTNFNLDAALRSGLTYDQVITSMTNRLNTAPPVAPAPVVPAAVAPATPIPEDQSFLRSVADVPLAFGKGVTSGVGMIADAFGAGSETSNAIKGAGGYLDSLMSAQSKQDSQEVSRIMEEADGKGVGAQVRAGLQALTVAPIDLITQSLGTMAPVVIGTLGSELLGAGALVTSGTSLLMSGLMGAGTIKGAMYDAVKAEPTLANLPPEQLEKIAQEAQAYGGENLDQILLGAGIGTIAGATGGEAALKAMGARIIARAAAKETAEQAAARMATSVTQAAEQKLLPAALKTAGVEGSTEFVQEGQEALAANAALRNEGVDVSLMRGVIPRATLGAGMGAIAGGGLGAVDARSERSAAQQLLLEQEDTDPLLEAAKALGDPNLIAYYEQRQRDNAAGDEDTELSNVPQDGSFSSIDTVTTDPTVGKRYTPEQEAQDAAYNESQQAADNVTEVDDDEVEALLRPFGGTGATRERPIKFDLPSSTDEDLDYLAGLAEAGGEEDRADALIKLANQRRMNANTGDASGKTKTVETEKKESKLGQKAPPTRDTDTTNLNTAIDQSERERLAAEKKIVQEQRDRDTEAANATALRQAEFEALKTKEETPSTATNATAAAPRVITSEELSALGVLPAALKGTGVGVIKTVLNPVATDEEKAVALETHAKNARVAGPVKAKLRGLAAELRTPMEPTVAPDVKPAANVAPDVKPAAVIEPVVDDAAGEELDEELDDAADQADDAADAVLTKGQVLQRDFDDALETQGGLQEEYDAAQKAGYTEQLSGIKKELDASQRETVRAGGALEESKTSMQPRSVKRRKTGIAQNPGRPKKDLTPGEAATRDASRKKNTQVQNQLARDADKGLRIVHASREELARATGQKVNPVQHALMRSPAIANAYRILAQTKGQDSRAREDAQATIDHPSVTQKEKDRAQQHVKENPDITLIGKARKGATRMERSTAPKLDSTFAKFTNALQAIAHIVKTGNPFQKALANKLKPFLKDVPIIMVTDVERDLPAGDIRDAFKGDNNNAAGLYVDDPNAPGGRAIYINNIAGEEGTDVSTVLHEAVHAATLRLVDAYLTNPSSLSPQQIQLMKQLDAVRVKAAMRWIDLESAGALRPSQIALEDVGAFGDLREFVAYGYTNDSMQNFLLHTDGTLDTGAKGYSSALARFLGTVRKMFNLGSDHTSAFLDLMVLTEDLLKISNIDLPPVALAAAARKTSRIQKIFKKLVLSNKATDIANGIGALTLETRDADEAVGVLSARLEAMDSRAKKIILPTLPTADVIRLAGGNTELSAINKNLQQMSAWRNRLNKELGETVEGFANWARTNPVAQRILANVMSVSTLLHVDASAHPDFNTAMANDPVLAELTKKLNDPTISQQEASRITGRKTSRTTDIKLVYDLWAQLGKQDPSGEAKGWYVKVKDQYKKTYDMHVEEMKQKVRESKLEGDPDASPEEFAKTPKGQLMASIVSLYETNKKIGVYFPLVRYGKYWIRTGKKGDRNGGFYMFESAVTRNLFKQKLAAENGKSVADMTREGEMESGDDPSKMRGQVTDTSAMLKKLYGIIDSGEVTDVTELKDSIYQLYLQTLPERDVRRNFMHRQGKAGFSLDVVRNLASTQLTAINQLARLRYTTKIQRAIDAAKATLNANPDLGVFVDEMEERAKMDLQPPDPASALNMVSSAATKTVFYYMMTAPKSAFIQMTQVPVVGTAVLGSKYGFGATLKMMAKYLNVFDKLSTTRTDSNGNVVTKWGQPSIRESAYIANNKDPAYGKLLARGWDALAIADKFTSTYASDLMARGDVSTSTYNSAIGTGFRRTANFMGGAFHHAERLSREIMGMSAFELAYAAALKRKLSPDAAFNVAVEEASLAVDEAMFNYSESNKPRLFRNPLLKAPLQFLTYPLQMTSFLVRNTWGMIKASPAQDRMQATQTLFTTLGMTALFAGLSGLPYPLYYALIGMMDSYRELMRTDIEDDDDMEMFKDMDEAGNPLGKRNMQLWFTNWAIPHYFGNGSDIAKFLDLSEEQAQTLSLAVNRGPISALTGIDFGSSMSLNGMWFRDDVPADTNRAAFTNMAVSMLGPVGGMGENMFSAFDDFEAGRISQGWEKLTPAMFRGPVAAARLAIEGSKTPSGAEILPSEHYTTGKLLAKSLGFADTEEAAIRKAATQAKKIDVEVSKERTAALAAVDRADPDNIDAIAAAFDKIVEYNNRNPFKPIRNSDINESLRSKARTRASAIQGVSVDKAMWPFIYGLMEPTMPVSED